MMVTMGVALSVEELLQRIAMRSQNRQKASCTPSINDYSRISV
jgi:hypothetical protein